MQKLSKSVTAMSYRTELETYVDVDQKIRSGKITVELRINEGGGVLAKKLLTFSVKGQDALVEASDVKRIQIAVNSGLLVRDSEWRETSSCVTENKGEGLMLSSSSTSIDRGLRFDPFIDVERIAGRAWSAATEYGISVKNFFRFGREFRLMVLKGRV